MYFSDNELDQLIHDDVPFVDLTTHVLGIGAAQGVMRYSGREPTLLCCTEEAVRILQKVGLQVDFSLSSGTYVEANTLILTAHGSAQAIHSGWRVALNLMEHACGVATRTHILVQRARAVNPHIVITATRKSLPWAKKMMVKAILTGGALPHRLGLSETFLLFDEHLRFMGGLDAALPQLRAIKTRLGEKMLVAEAHNAADALKLAQAGVDMVQLDKLSVDATRQVNEQLKTAVPSVKVAIAGGINAENCAAYAATGVDMLVTSALYFGKPADIKADIQASIPIC